MFHEHIVGEHNFKALKRGNIWTIWADSPNLAWNVMDVLAMTELPPDSTYFEGKSV